MVQPIDGGRGKKLVTGEGLIPLSEVEVARHDAGGLLVALDDQIAQILVDARRAGV